MIYLLEIANQPKNLRCVATVIIKLTFVADKPPPSHVFEQVALAAAEESGEHA